ncbi:hypothetical protein CPB84DRAFT_1847730 [Gymnopilus junonius]|uniref:Uncharacterized protein n=1 Tax=Gymnopilus junonius TaxID=109634 RepID=A0A9P5NJT2_GYMJU|nr:hypothetical protein CPB84DRAFT_1847730 [Gymnopilus junonius]
MPLTQAQRDHFLEHGWIKIPNAISKPIIDEWTKNVWVRLGWDEHDKATWEEEYVKMPRHREIPVQEFAPSAWEAMCEIHESPPPQELRGWHHDNDWYRQFLDSSGNALTIVHCFTDVPPRGGGTWLAEDGIEAIAKYLYDHPDGLDPPFEKILYTHIKDCQKFVQVEAKAGDTFILHGLLPHTHGVNHLHFARIITNPHVNMVDPFNLNRSDGNYPLFFPLLMFRYHPRTAPFKRSRVEPELRRMLEHAQANGLPPSSVDSVYLQSNEAIKRHEERNGYDQPHGPGPIAYSKKDYHG